MNLRTLPRSKDANIRDVLQKLSSLFSVSKLQDHEAVTLASRRSPVNHSGVTEVVAFNG